MSERTVHGLLRDQALRQPDNAAYTYIDYDIDPVGLPESVTWAQLHQRVRVVADALASCGSVGERAAIVAPQGLDYIVAFLGAIQAGFIAVPLSVPQFGTPDERVSGALRDCSPAALLTTSAVVESMMSYAKPQPGRPAPRIIEVDALPLDSPLASADNSAERESRTAYLQYTSGSTRSPSGVVITHENAIANVEQVIADVLNGEIPPHLTVVSWLPLFHDFGLVISLLLPLLSGRPAVLSNPTSFMQKPVRWLRSLAIHSQPFSGAPNFGFELAVRRASDDDMAGLDLSDVRVIVNGSERVHAPTLRRFYERFAPFNLPAAAVRTAYGLAEATLYVTASAVGNPPVVARFDQHELSVGHAERSDDGIEMVSCGPPRSCMVRIVDPQTRTENPADMVGEVWLLGPNIADGYWHNAQLSNDTFGAELADASPGTPVGPWLRTGDLGVISEGELFVVSRIKDLLIVDGRNHYPDDIEATVREITGGRVAAIAAADGHTEKLVVIADVKKQAALPSEATDALRALKREVTAAVSSTHSLRLSDLVLVSPGSIPVTTSGKVRRASCLDLYRREEFSRLDAIP